MSFCNYFRVCWSLLSPDIGISLPGHLIKIILSPGKVSRVRGAHVGRQLLPGYASSALGLPSGRGVGGATCMISSTVRHRGQQRQHRRNTADQSPNILIL